MSAKVTAFLSATPYQYEIVVVGIAFPVYRKPILIVRQVNPRKNNLRPEPTTVGTERLGVAGILVV